MQYLNREILANLSTPEMLLQIPDKERIPLLKHAAIIRDVLHELPEGERPAFSNVAVANLSYMLREGSVTPLPLMFSECFVLTLIRHCRWLEGGLARHIEHELVRVNELMPADEIDDMRRMFNERRKTQKAFDFTLID